MSDLVSVIMSVFNEPLYMVKCSVESILAQTYSFLEFIIIDDGANEEVRQYLRNISNYDYRVMLIINSENIGLTKSLNKGLKASSGVFVARMDADDYSTPRRLKKQVDYFFRHDVDILGTAAVSFGNKSIFMSPAFGMNPLRVNANLFFTSCLCHPSVMIRRAFIETHNIIYDEAFQKAQDFDLWERASCNGKLAVMHNVLLLYRIHTNQISRISKQEQFCATRLIIERRFARLGINMTDKQYAAHMSLKGLTRSDYYAASKWVELICRSNDEVKFCDCDMLRHELNKRLFILKLKLLVFHKTSFLSCVSIELLEQIILFALSKLSASIKLFICRLYIISRKRYLE